MKSGWNKYGVNFFISTIFLSFNMAETANNTQVKIEQATFGSGCFWCVEAVFEQLEGVIDVQVGYTGGRTENPTYEEVCTGKSGHAEVIRIDYDPRIIRFEKLLDVFWKSHDPTTLNSEGGDVGTQYRSSIYYHSKDQQSVAENSKKYMDKSRYYSNHIVTEISPLKEYYPAEDYHQGYYRNNPTAPYCQFVIKPKLDKLSKP